MQIIHELELFGGTLGFLPIITLEASTLVLSGEASAVDEQPMAPITAIRLVSKLRSTRECSLSGIVCRASILLATIGIDSIGYNTMRSLVKGRVVGAGQYWVVDVPATWWCPHCFLIRIAYCVLLYLVSICEHDEQTGWQQLATIGNDSTQAETYDLRENHFREFRVLSFLSCFHLLHNLCETLSWSIPCFRKCDHLKLNQIES